jgi:transcriptional regulator with XRE-family HTH domain
MRIEPDDLRVLAGFLRLLRHRTQAEMAAACRLHPSTVSRYEEGTRIPDRPAIERLARGAGVPMWAVDGAILPAIALARAAVDTAERLPESVQQTLAAALAEGPSDAASAAVAEFLAEIDAGSLDGADEMAGNQAAGEEGAAVPDPWTLALAAATEGLAENSAWWLEFEGFVERLCEASVRAASDAAGRALGLAHLALGVARLAPGPAPWRCRLEGFAWSFIGNAQRVGCDLPAAGTSLATARRLWGAGAAAPNTRIGEWRLLELEASLRRDERHFDRALDLLDRARALAPAVAQGRILLKKSYTLEQAGEAEPALAALEEAAPLIGLEGEPHRFWTLRINRLVLLCHLGRFHEAEAGLPELHEQARQLGNDLDQLRARWLTGRVHAGRGRHEEARSVFEEVRQKFAQRLLGYDTALVSLELAILELEAGRLAAVRELADTMLWIFTAQGVEREALAALGLFREAVEGETVTIELARSVLEVIERTCGAWRRLAAART